MRVSKQENIQQKSDQIQQKSEQFTLSGKGELPAYNALKAGYEPVEPFSESFADQFRFKEPPVIKKQLHKHIFLPDYTYQKPGLNPVNVFNPQSGFRQIEASRSPAWKTKKTEKDQGPHSFNALHGGMVQKAEKNGFLESLRPVPLVKLTKKQQSYTHQVNEIISISPVSKGQFQATDAMMGILIGFILFFLYLRTVFGRYVRTFTRSVFNRVRAMNVFEESNMIMGRVSFMLNFFYFLVVGLLFTHWFDYKGFVILDLGQLQTFFVLSGVVVVLYLLKWIFAWILAHFLQIQNETRAYFFHIFIFNKSFAIVIFPFLLVLPYIDAQWGILILMGAFILMGFFYFLRLIRLLTYSIQRKLSLFYLFLYLCALEFIPILVIVKLSSEWLKLPVF